MLSNSTNRMPSVVLIEKNLDVPSKSFTAKIKAYAKVIDLPIAAAIEKRNEILAVISENSSAVGVDCRRKVDSYECDIVNEKLFKTIDGGRGKIAIDDTQLTKYATAIGISLEKAINKSNLGLETLRKNKVDFHALQSEIKE
jgi:hypothetical protein